MQRKFISLLLFAALVAVMAAGIALGAQQALAEEGTTPQQATPSPMHPAYALLDADGNPVAQSGKPADLVKTCGACHDTAFITSHATHQKAEQIAGFEGMIASCYLCHSTAPNGAARKAALQSGDKAWADSAVLLGSGILEKTADGWQWNANAFDAEGKLKADYVNIHQPTNANCAQCHGAVHTDLKTPFVLENPADQWVTLTTGQVVSPQRISASGMNIEGKEAMPFAWDVHAERGLQCVDCHSSANAPSARRYSELPGYLTFDPRHPAVGEYLKKPSHVLTQNRCESCHDPVAAHKQWLPYLELHMSKVACETCHVPQLHAPAAETFDKTVVLPNGSTPIVYRGIVSSDKAAPGADAHEPFTVSHQVVGFQPVLLKNEEGKEAPYNLVTTFEWVAKQNGKDVAVSLDDLKKAWMPDGQYASEIVKAFDANGDGKLSAEEVALDSQEKVDLIAKRLSALGLSEPHIVGVVKPYPIHHDVVQSDYAVQDCRVCHGPNSRVGKPMAVAISAPAGVTPTFDGGTLQDAGKVVVQDGAFYYQPEKDAKLYLAGRDHIRWIDLLGVLAFVGTLLGVMFHGALRVYFAKKYPPHHGRTKPEYLYTGAERFWHWLQMTAILLLLLLGLVIHNPDWLGGLSFRYLVFAHTVLGWILVGNFVLALYYFLATDYLKQFVPKPQGFFSRALLQARFYIQGIFRGEPHPFKKSFWDKLNPMQRMAYFGLLFGLLPIQMITGVWLWAARVWPVVADWFGATTMTWVAAIHTLDAWLIAAFVVGHVYLTTTGAHPLEYIKAMITGWEEVEVDEDEVVA